MRTNKASTTIQPTSYFWLGMVSRTALRNRIGKEFRDLDRGKIANLTDLCPGDGILYFSPAERQEHVILAEAFTAFGDVLDSPSKRKAGSVNGGTGDRLLRLTSTTEVPMRPLFGQLTFARTEDWRLRTLHGFIRILPEDYRVIAEAMQVPEIP